MSVAARNGADIAEEARSGKGMAGRAAAASLPVILEAGPAPGQQAERSDSLPKGYRACPACTARSARHRATCRHRASGHQRRRPLSQPARAQDPAGRRLVARPATQTAARQKPTDRRVFWVALKSSSLARRPITIRRSVAAPMAWDATSNHHRRRGRSHRTRRWGDILPMVPDASPNRIRHGPGRGRLPCFESGVRLFGA